MTIEQQNNDVADYGRKAIEAWKSSDREGGKGDSLAVFALAQAWPVMQFTAVIEDKKGKTQETDSFDLADHYHDRNTRQNDGSRNIKLVAARTRAIIQRVFGVDIEEMDKPQAAAMKQRVIQRSLSVVADLFRLGYDETNISLNRHNQLEVPFPLMNNEPGDKATDNERKTYNALAETTVALDGKGRNSMAELRKRIKPVETRAAEQGKAPDKGQALSDATKFVTASIQSLMSEDATDDMPALNETRRNELHALFTVLGGYFTADPVEVKKEEKNKKAA